MSLSQGVTAECGDSANSSPLTVVCDGVLPPQLTRVATGTAGTIKVCWNLPTVQGNIKIRSYQVKNSEIQLINFITFDLIV